jgi:GNAT superfamily N-acetyltransferase
MSENKSRAFLRQYNANTDLDAAVHIFRETADDSLKVEPLWTIGSFIWCRPYLHLSPSTCFVVDDGTGRAVGYIIGTPDTTKFCEDWHKSYVPAMEPELNSLPSIDAQAENKENIAQRRDSLVDLIRTNPRKLMFGSYEEQLRSYPGHLHIDILPSHQRQGFGRKLIGAFKDAAKAESCPGAYLGMIASNDNAKKFYESIGFGRLPQVLDGGVTGELGRTGKRPDDADVIYFVVEL